MELFGHHGVFRVSTQLWGAPVVKQYPIADRFRRRHHGIAKSDVHLQRDARAVELGQEVDPHPAVASLLADFRSLDRGGTEPDPVFHRDPADFAEGGHDRVDVIGAKAQQVGIARRPVRQVIPDRKQQCALEQEVVRVDGEMNRRYSRRSRP